MTNYKLTLKSKRLKSGKCQIQFFVSEGKRQTHYGYLLAESSTTLKEVVGKIELSVRSGLSTSMNQHGLYNLNDRSRVSENILLFNN